MSTEDFEPAERGRRGGGRGPRRHGGGSRRRRGANRGDARLAVLALLAEEPMHGYQIMNELSERTSGAWQPSPGSIYPLLAQLTDEGLLACEEGDGRKVFHLTASGKEEAASATSRPPVWQQFTETDGRVDLRDAIGALAAAVKQVGATGTPEQVARAADIITEARKGLYQLLAE